MKSAGGSLEGGVISTAQGRADQNCPPRVGQAVQAWMHRGGQKVDPGVEGAAIRQPMTPEAPRGGCLIPALRTGSTTRIL